MQHALVWGAVSTQRLNNGQPPYLAKCFSKQLEKATEMSVIDVSKLKYRKNVGMVLINAQGHIFAGKRIDNNTGAWQMPQGGIDEDEAPETAAFRELTEETGINPRNARLLFSTVEWLSYDIPVELIPQLWNGQFRGQKQKWFAFEFLGKDSDINIATEEPEFSE